VEDEADAVVRIAGAKKLVRNDDQRVTRVVVGDRFSIRVFARLKTAANNDDGADIHDVTFEVNGGDIYERTERNAAYCMFGGGDDKNEQSCTIWSFADHGNHWPNDGAELDTSDSYTVRIFVRAKDDTKVADWNFQLEVRP
jgi:hypothetical protein